MLLSAALLKSPSLSTLRAWRDELPAMDPVGVAGQLADTLTALNRRDLDAKLRFELMEAVSLPVLDAVAEISRLLVGQNFPVSGHARTAGELSARLHEACIAGYRLVYAAQPSWLNRLAGNDWQRLATARLLNLFDSYITHLRLAGAAVPEGTWCDIHRIYLHARKLRWNTRALAGSGPGCPKHSIDDAYAQLLLTAMLPVQQLTPQTWEFVSQALPSWSRFVSFGTVGGATPGYCVKLVADSPPRPLDPDDAALPKEHCLRIHTARLARFLRRSKSPSLSPPTLVLLHESWCKPPVRRHIRREANREGEAVLGLGTLHHLLAFEAAAEKVAANPQGATPHDVDPGEGEGPDTTERCSPAQSEAGNEVRMHGNAGPVQRALSAHIDNVSASGLRLAFDRRLPLATRAGDLVGVKDPHNHWHAGVIRWLTEDPHKLRAGIELLAFECTAVALIGHARERPELHLAALAGMTRNHRHVLAIPAHPSRHVESFAAVVGDRTSPVVVKRVLLETPRFQLLEIEPLTLDSPTRFP